MKIIVCQRALFPHPFTALYSIDLKPKKAGKERVLAATQVERIKRKGHSFESISGRRIGKTTAPYRSTADRTMFSIDTRQETY